ncbi:MAG: methionyl-tRNA formyltransferase [Vicinamibacterales bacterium]
MSSQTYVVATVRPWNIARFHALRPALGSQWHLISDPAELTMERLAAIAPRYVFFPHWSTRVPSTIVGAYECVCFHETDVPYGRGGSPLQNLIARGHTETVVTALRMVEELDAGPVYGRRPLSLHGLAEEIYVRTAGIVFDMAIDIAAREPQAAPQVGEATVFKRRTPSESVVDPATPGLAPLFDHLRMLDAEGYPPAFIDHGRFRLEFSRPALRTNRIEATVSIVERPEGEGR